MSKYFVGLMSGTSIDAIDAAVIDLAQSSPIESLLTARYFKAPPRKVPDENILIWTDYLDN